MTDVTISKCPSCGQEMHPTDYLDRIRNDLAAAQARADENERDARRYRKITADMPSAGQLIESWNADGEATVEEFDAAIDAAMTPEEAAPK